MKNIRNIFIIILLFTCFSVQAQSDLYSLIEKMKEEEYDLPPKDPKGDMYFTGKVLIMNVPLILINNSSISSSDLNNYSLNNIHKILYVVNNGNPDNLFEALYGTRSTWGIIWIFTKDYESKDLMKVNPTYNIKEYEF